MNLFRQHFSRQRIIFSSIALIAVLVGYIFFTRPAHAQVGIDAGDGAAAWVFQSCADDETGDTAQTTMTLDTSDATGGTLNIRTDNGYPGYRFHCIATLANTGDIPITLTAVGVNNPHPTKLLVEAHPEAFDVGKTIQPCGTAPAWGTDPATIPAECQLSIAVEVLVLGEASPGAEYGYAVTASLE